MASNWIKTAAAAAALALTACGGGGSAAPVEAVVTGVSTPTMLEGNAGTTDMLFTVSLDKPAIAAFPVKYSTVSTAKPGGGGTGSAVGGAACGAGTDYVSASNQTLTIPAGSNSGTIRVPVCGNTTFKPLLTFNLAWSGNGGSGTVTATILNDDPGGLNGTGVAGTFGRDSQPLQNAGGDGRLGFSFASVTDAGGVNCISDNVTGLMWEGIGGAGIHAAANTFTFAGVSAHVTAVNTANAGAGTCGFTDWRMPTPEELASLVDNGTATAPTADSVFLATTAAAQYWTSTTYRDGTGLNGWFVDFNSGTIGSQDKTQTYGARLVRRYAAAPAALPTSCTDAARFTNHGDSTVTDNRTGLMWKQCAEGFSGGACATGAPANLDWAGAIARPAAVNADAANSGLGYGDWRLPTRAELSSITEREQCDATGGVASVIATVFPNTGAQDYWTQTPDAFNAAQAWRVNFLDGEVAVSAKTGVAASKRVRLVRAGQ